LHVQYNIQQIYYEKNINIQWKIIANIPENIVVITKVLAGNIPFSDLCFLICLLHGDYDVPAKNEPCFENPCRSIHNHGFDLASVI